MRQYQCILILSFLLLGAISLSSAQTVKSNLTEIKIIATHVAKKKGANVEIDFTMDFSEMTPLKRNTLMQVTPMLRSNTSDDFLALTPFLLTGKTRDIVLQRYMAADKDHLYRKPARKPMFILSPKRGREQQVHYATQVPFAAWMKDASLILCSENTGCADCPLGMEENVFVPNVLFPLYEAHYKYASVVPEGELLKRREESLMAYINFVVDRYEILPSLGNNPQELKRVDIKMQEMINDKSISIDKLSLVGYASPEGGVEHNLKLSRNRVNSFADYLVAKYPPFRGKYSTEAKGQDWDGLRSAIAESNLREKDEIIHIIDNVAVRERSNALKNLNGGETYATLLQDFYPPLRRSEVIFSFVVKGFDLSEAKEMIKVHPRRLSLAEVYAVVQSYPQGSQEQYDTWITAVDAFPKAPEPVINAVIMDFDAGRYEQALRLLERRKDNVHLWGLLGVAYAYNERYEEAEKYLIWAVQKNLPNARHNLDELKQFMRDNL